MSYDAEEPERNELARRIGSHRIEARQSWLLAADAWRYDRSRRSRRRLSDGLIYLALVVLVLASLVFMFKASHLLFAVAVATVIAVWFVRAVGTITIHVLQLFQPGRGRGRWFDYEASPEEFDDRFDERPAGAGGTGTIPKPRRRPKR
jgi:hypothetical protein